MYPGEDYDQNNYPEYYYANKLFTTMAYATFWDKDLDKYEGDDAKYVSQSYNLGALPDYIKWDRLDCYLATKLVSR